MRLTCREVMRMVSEGLDRRLPITQRALVRAHCVVCRGCRAARERLQFLRRAMSRMAEHD